MKIGSPGLRLLPFALKSLSSQAPGAWFLQSGPRSRTAAIFWGKGAAATAREWDRARRGVKFPSLVIAPRGHRVPARAGREVVYGEHPLPGDGSLAAGRAIERFLRDLNRLGLRRLDIYLSGGASSLAWMPKRSLGGQAAKGAANARILKQGLLKKLRALYARPLSIERLNAERSKLCTLKAGGAARALHALAPGVSARVILASDVGSFPLSVVGSGPFWDGVIPHRVVASNARWVMELARQARRAGVRVRCARRDDTGTWEAWVERVAREIQATRSGIGIVGGEPLVRLRANGKAGAPPSGGRSRGGRQTQIAAALLERFAAEIAAGELEILCLASDGVDGRSRSMGAWLRASVGRAALEQPAPLRRAIERLDSASVLGAWGALVHSRETGANVQDVVIFLHRGAAREAP